MASDHGSGGMDISQHKKTWSGFVKFIEWSLASVFVLMFFLMLFRTHG